MTLIVAKIKRSMNINILFLRLGFRWSDVIREFRTSTWINVRTGDSIFEIIRREFNCRKRIIEPRCAIKWSVQIFLQFCANMFEVLIEVFWKMDGCLVARGKLQPWTTALQHCARRFHIETSYHLPVISFCSNFVRYEK